MKLGFEEAQARYVSGSQNARAWTERWVATWIYCPQCGHSTLRQLPANQPVADFVCLSCSEQFEVKGQKAPFRDKILDGAFKTMRERLAASDNPNLILLNYDLPRHSVTNVIVIPRQFFVLKTIEERPPLAPRAKRAGWIGCKILLRQIPDVGKIFVVRDEIAQPKELVLAQWHQTTFLREENLAARGWLLEVIKCVEAIGKTEFVLDEVYEFEAALRDIFPENRHIRQKIRQQLQVLRDRRYLEFVSPGRYRLRTTP